jgi:hypothetical protein
MSELMGRAFPANASCGAGYILRKITSLQKSSTPVRLPKDEGETGELIVTTMTKEAFRAALPYTGFNPHCENPLRLRADNGAYG